MKFNKVRLLTGDLWERMKFIHIFHNIEPKTKLRVQDIGPQWCYRPQA